jgi:hypothetical protein
MLIVYKEDFKLEFEFERYLDDEDDREDGK